MSGSGVSGALTAAGELKTAMEQATWTPIDLDSDDFKGLFADKMLARIAAYNTFATETAANAETFESLTDQQDTADRALAAAPTEAQVDAAYDKYDASFEHGDYEETERLLKEWEQLKRERDAAVKAHEEASDALREKFEELAEKQGDADPTKGDPSENDDWRDDQDKDGKPKGESKPDSPAKARTLDDVIDSGGDDSTPTGKTQLSADAAPVQSQSGYPTIYPTAAQQQPPTAAAMPSPSATPAFNSALNPSPSRQRDKDKEKKRPEEKINPLPVPSPVPAAVPIDRGTSTTGVTTKDISGKPSPVTALTNAAPGSSTQTAGGRGAGGGSMVGGMPHGGAGGSIGAGNKATTSQKILDSDRTLTRRADDDPSVSGGVLSKDNVGENARKEAAADDEILRRNAAGDPKKDDKR